MQTIQKMFFRAVTKEIRKKVISINTTYFGVDKFKLFIPFRMCKNC